MATPSLDEQQDLLFSARYGELDEVKEFVAKFGPEYLSSVVDDNGNTILHMVAGNGHDDILEYVLPLIPSALLSAQNNALSTPLHWASLNSHLSTVKKLITYPDGQGPDLIDIKNAAGRTPLSEAEMSGWEEGSKYLVEVMNLKLEGEGGDQDNTAGEEEDINGDTLPEDTAQDIEVEIQDAEGGIAKMVIAKGSSSSVPPTTPRTSQTTSIP